MTDLYVLALYVLAKRAEKAGAEEQHRLLIEAYHLIFPEDASPPDLASAKLSGVRLSKFHRKLDAEAYESAALMLAPEGSDVWQLIYAAFRVRRAATPALALTAACLRAVALDYRHEPDSDSTNDGKHNGQP